MNVRRAFFIFTIALIGAFSGVVISDVATAGDESHLIEVFTDSQTPALNNGPSTTVYIVDRIDRLQQALSEGLPAEPEAAKQAALQRFQRMDAQLSSELENAAKGLVQAMQYGIDRYPAIVIDGKAVVYGVTDVKAATRLYEQWREGGEKL